MSKKLLIIEDDDTTRTDIVQSYRDKAWKVYAANSLQQAKRLLLEDEINPHVILADLGLPDGNILDHIEDLHSHIDYSEWVFTFETKDSFDVDRLSNLAYECLTFPYNDKRLEIILNRAYRASVTARRLQSYTYVDAQKYNLEAYWGNSSAVNELKELIGSLTHVPISTMIISGETGTGKGLVARIIHHVGLRKGGPLVELNCAALPKDLLESQLFGHEAGAFTGAAKKHKGLFEQADGGTIFLDEISEMDLELQAKLLKALEDKKLRRLGGEKEISIDTQIIAACGKNLEEAVRQNEFREDLYHRLSVFQIALPPLRERKEDLLELVPRFIAEYNEKAKKNVEIIPDEVWETISQHNWPGNVRELRNVIERCVLLSTDNILPAKWLQLGQLNASANIHNTEDEQSPNSSITISIDGTLSLDEIESNIIRKALAESENNVTEAARLLRTTRETLRYRIQKHGIDIS